MKTNLWIKGLTLSLVAVSILSCGNKKNEKQSKSIVRPTATATQSTAGNSTNGTNTGTTPSSGNGTTGSTSTTTGPADAPGNAAATIQAQSQAQLDINWNSTEILEESGQHALLNNKFTFNNVTLDVQSLLDWRGINNSGDIKNCDEANLPYDVDWNDKQTGPSYWAVGKTVCLIDSEVHVGLDFFAWNEKGMIAEKVLLNISEAKLVRNIVKTFYDDNNRMYLPTWVNEQADYVIKDLAMEK